MGNYRFRLSNMLPNSWFYGSITGKRSKSRMTKTQPVATSTSSPTSSSSFSTLQPSSAAADQRKSYYFTRDLTTGPDRSRTDESLLSPSDTNSQRKSSSKKRTTSLAKKPIRQKREQCIYRPGSKTSSSDTSSQEQFVSNCSDKDMAQSQKQFVNWCYRDMSQEQLSSCSYKDMSVSHKQYMSNEQYVVNCSCNDMSNSQKQLVSCFCQDMSSREQNVNSTYEDVYGKIDLPRIITKSAKNNESRSDKWVIDGGRRSLSVRIVNDGGVGSPVRKAKRSVRSPRVGNRVKIQGINGGRRSYGYRRSLSESMAVVKTSVDPGRDFKESMVEMIRENKMKSSKDLEELLACYLCLNSDEYHDLIIKVFKQIWFESTNIRL